MPRQVTQKVTYGKCIRCGVWEGILDLALAWQESEGVIRGVCELCQETLNKEANKLDWEHDGD